MDDAGAACVAGLPTHDDVLRNADCQAHTSVPMLSAWRVARDIGFISAESFEEICRRQITLINSELEHVSGVEFILTLMQLRSDYELELAKGRNAWLLPRAAP